MDGAARDDKHQAVSREPDISEEENNLKGPLFNPPVYQQRYAAVRELITQLQPRKVVDMGCAECKLLRLLKFENCIEDLIGVDMDTTVMYPSRRHLEPLTTDYIFRRPKPLRVRLMKGSIADADSALTDTDLFSCIEVIEHLEEPILKAVPQSVFGCLRPSVAIFSTPNSEFNVLFPNFTGFRHPDHKFEWTRQEFRTWCSSICDQYGYKVQYTGVGDPPPNRTNLGHCSQIAIFTKLTTHKAESTSMEFTSSYELIFDCCFPYETITQTEKLCREAEYYIRLLSKDYNQGCDYQCDGKEDEQRDTMSLEEYRSVGDSADQAAVKSDSEETGVVLVRLTDLLRFHSIQRLTSDVEEIRQAIISHSNFKLKSHRETYFVVVEAEPDEDTISSDIIEDDTIVFGNGTTMEDNGMQGDSSTVSQSENWDSD